MKNRNTPIFASARPTQVATDFRLPGRNERMVGRNGELNASSTKDLLNNISSMLEAASNNNLVTEDAATRAELAQARRVAVLAAFDSKEELAALGQEMAADLAISANKEGFMRRLFVRGELVQGQRPTARMKMKNVAAVAASGPVRTQTQFVRDNWLTPPEFYITARPYMEQRDIDATNTDILSEKYDETLEAIMVVEDRTWRAMAQQSVGAANEATTILGNLNPSAFASIRNQVASWGIPVTTALLAQDLWTDIVADAGFQQIIDPVSKHELLLTGELGRILGTRLITDAFRHPTHKVLAAGELWMVGDAEFHGQYTDRGGITAQPLDGTNENVPGRGWFLHESISMVLANARSVAFAKRIVSQ